MCDALLSDKPLDKKETLKALAIILEDSDWDCQPDSDYWDHPIMHEIMEELHPGWYQE